MSVTTWINDYLAKQAALYAQLPVEKVSDIADAMLKVLENDRGIYAFGNGGSASSCSHFATDLGKGASDAIGKAFNVVSLNDNVSWITAIANDYSYEDVFFRQLKNIGKKGDLAITVSVSGNSPNCVKAMKWAKENGLTTVAFVGGKRGALADLCDHVIVVDETHYGRAEDLHMTLLHLLCYVFIEKILALKAA